MDGAGVDCTGVGDGGTDELLLRFSIFIGVTLW